jgi:hypothetical protein
MDWAIAGAAKTPAAAPTAVLLKNSRLFMVLLLNELFFVL